MKLPVEMNETSLNKLLQLAKVALCSISAACYNLIMSSLRTTSK